MITKCNTLNTNKIVSVSENKRVFKILNNTTKSINKVQVDGCFIIDDAKCDWLFEIAQKDTILSVFYVKLKGSDISHAIEQLEATIQQCKPLHNRYKKESYIVASRFPKAGPSSQVLKKKFLSKNKIQLFIGTNKKEVSV